MLTGTGAAKEGHSRGHPGPRSGYRKRKGQHGDFVLLSAVQELIAEQDFTPRPPKRSKPDLSNKDDWNDTD